jgi:hypothetical protein
MNKKKEYIFVTRKNIMKKQLKTFFYAILNLPDKRKQNPKFSRQDKNFLFYFIS